MTKTAFISRELSEAPVFVARLQAAGWQVAGQSLVVLTPLPVAELPQTDWIFFASKQAVKFFFEAGESRVTSARLAALGPATAREIRRYAGPVDFTGTGEPESTATAFLPLAKGLTVLFPAARHSEKSIARLLGNAITAIHLAIYDNAPLPCPGESDARALVFTSPMNARAYFKTHRLKTGQRVVAIGRTTAKALLSLGVSEVLVAAEPTEAALAEAVLTLG